MHHHLVDHHLGEQRGPEGEYLDDQGGDQDIAPHLAVLEQLGDEPVEAEPCPRGQRPVRVLQRRRGKCQLERGAGETGGEFRRGQGFGGVAAGLEQHHNIIAGLDDDGGAPAGLGSITHGPFPRAGREIQRFHRPQHDQAGQIESRHLAGRAFPALDLEAQGTGRVNEGIGGIRRRELLRQQPRVEGLAVQGTETSHGPHHVFHREPIGRGELPSTGAEPRHPPQAYTLRHRPI